MPAPTPNLEASFAVLVEDTLRRCDRIEAQLRLARQEYSGRIEDRSYLTFIEALSLSTEGARARVGQIQGEFHEFTNKDDSYNDLGALAASLDGELEAYVPPLSIPRPDELEVFAVPFTRVAKALVPNVEVLFFSWYYDGFRADVYDYDAARGLDSVVATNLRREFGPDFKFLLLRHPAGRARDMFHHLVFGHELAHVAIELEAPKTGLPADITEPPHEDVRDARQRTWSNVATDGVRMPPLLSAQREQLLDWFHELACDIFAIRLFGPAFVVAFAEVTAPNRRLEPSKKPSHHPPTPLRFAVLRYELKRFSFDPRSAELQPILERYLSSYPRETKADDELPGSETWLKQALRRFRKNLPRQLGTLEYRPSSLAADLPLVFRLADSDIPPAERVTVFEPSEHGGPKSARGMDKAQPTWSDPIDWRSIINGLYLWHLSRVPFPDAHLGEDRGAAGVRSKERVKAIRLAVGAVELSEFHRRAAKLSGEVKNMQPLNLGLRHGEPA